MGICKGGALGLIGRAGPAPTPERRDSALARALAHAAALGVTATSHMAASWEDLASYHRLEQAGRLTLRVAVYLPLDAWRAVADSVRRGGAGGALGEIGRVHGVLGRAAGLRPTHPLRTLH